MVGEDAGKICRGWWKKLIDMHVLGPFLSELLIPRKNENKSRLTQVGKTNALCK